MADVLFKIEENPPPRLDKALARNVPERAISRSRLSRMIEQGVVEVNGVVVTNQKAKVLVGDEIVIHVPEVLESHMLPEDIVLDIVYEDGDLIVVNKPVGMVVHPAPGTPSGTLVNALLAHCGDQLSGVGGLKRPGIVHRIDKDTTGLLVVAKTDAAHQGLATQFEDRSIDRLYQAICFGVPSAADPRLMGLSGTSFETGNQLKITTQIARHKTDRQRQAVVFQNGKHAVTRVRVIQDLAEGAAALVECKLETGRTHQIRVHMSYAGHALIGDQIYSRRRKLAGHHTDVAKDFPRQALHAAYLGFRHPITGINMHFEAPIPSDMLDLIAAIS
ncbi:MAG: RluA family pseudouridine synthase [Planktomarina sp.]|nr:RluA family pseudouridine synthase [Planktomarina sp.]